VLAKRPNLRWQAIIREAAIDAGGGSHSGYELDFLNLCRRYRLPMPSRQLVRTDESGQPRYTDAEFDEYNLVVEIDGSQHMDVQSWWRDMFAQNELHVEGKTVFRYPGFVIRHQHWIPAHQIQRFIASAEDRRSA